MSIYYKPPRNVKSYIVKTERVSTAQYFVGCIKENKNT